VLLRRRRYDTARFVDDDRSCSARTDIESKNVCRHGFALSTPQKLKSLAVPRS
jgi:hypothetical protein